MAGSRPRRDGGSGRGHGPRKVKLRARLAHYDQEVLLFDDTWNGHILPGHPEVAPYEDLILPTLTNPELILEDTTGSGSSLFLSDPFRGASFFAGSRLHVVVRIDLTPCLIPTLYLSGTRGRGTVVYRRKK